MGVKRYVALVFIGTVTFALALAMLLAYVYRTFDVPESAGWLVHVVTLQWIAHPWREVGLGALGVLVAVGGTIALFKSVLGVVIGPDEDVAEIIYQGRIRQRGPVVVSIGGGTGQGVLLRGLKEKTSNLTAVHRIGAICKAQSANMGPHRGQIKVLTDSNRAVQLHGFIHHFARHQGRHNFDL